MLNQTLRIGKLPRSPAGTPCRAAQRGLALPMRGGVSQVLGCECREVFTVSAPSWVGVALVCGEALRGNPFGPEVVGASGSGDEPFP